MVKARMAIRLVTTVMARASFSFAFSQRGDYFEGPLPLDARYSRA
jgi:hypothetical protein